MRILNLVIEEMACAHYREQNKFCTRIEFNLAEGQVPFLITPLMLVPQFWTSMGKTQKPKKVIYRWPPKCQLCNSEAHLACRCPWLGIEISGCRPNFNNCQNHNPGWVELQLRPKKPFIEAATDFLDIRPMCEKACRKRQTASKGKKQAETQEKNAIYMTRP